MTTATIEFLDPFLSRPVSTLSANSVSLQGSEPGSNAPLQEPCSFGTIIAVVVESTSRPSPPADTHARPLVVIRVHDSHLVALPIERLPAPTAQDSVHLNDEEAVVLLDHYFSILRSAPIKVISQLSRPDMLSLERKMRPQSISKLLFDDGACGEDAEHPSRTNGGRRGARAQPSFGRGKLRQLLGSPATK